MEKSIGRFTRIAYAVVVGMVISHCQMARAGWTVTNMNWSRGTGTVIVKVTSASGDVTNVTTGPLVILNPSATINKQSNFVFAATGSLPLHADARTYVQVRASANYQTSIQSTNLAGDIGDSDDLVQFVTPSSACAGSNVEIIPIQTTANSITFQYKAKLSDAGSAVLLRVIDIVTGKQKYMILLVGPYDNTASDCEGTITVTGDPDNLNMLLDGHTSTLPFNITCPPDMVLGCSAPSTYDPPAVATGDTGPFTITYDKLPSQLVLGANVVTATATDINGCTVSCQFNVFRQSLINFDGFFSPIDGPSTSGDPLPCGTPLRTFKLGNVVPVKFKMTCDGQDVTSGIPSITIQNC